VYRYPRAQLLRKPFELGLGYDIGFFEIWQPNNQFRGIDANGGRAVDRFELGTRKVAEKSREWVWINIGLVAINFLTQYNVQTKNQ
jgi:hypothetical protein